MEAKIILMPTKSIDFKVFVKKMFQDALGTGKNGECKR
jgi:hypothetical protein